MVSELSHREQREIVLLFYDSVTNKSDFDAAAVFLGDRFIQHRSDAPDGREGLKQFIQRRHAKYPRSHTEVKHVFVDGDFVILHVHVVHEPGSRGSNHVDIFRLEGRSVVEHWDVDEPIPAESANPNGVFYERP
ncbi:MAG TPA: ester cyclase [Kofleriaceae bacterium]|jgi:predicted SnoaL-like aldol condensation-catalyzing enzyme|nr:ester cyclase [Kofleriaceae bacterium]